MRCRDARTGMDADQTGVTDVFAQFIWLKSLRVQLYALSANKTPAAVSSEFALNIIYTSQGFWGFGVLGFWGGHDVT